MASPLGASYPSQDVQAREELLGYRGDASPVLGGGYDRSEAFRQILEDVETTNEQMDSSIENLNQTSELFRGIYEAYGRFGEHLRGASKYLAELKRKAATDSSYVWRAFWFFVFVCVFIVLKRLAVLRIALWAVRNSIKLSMKVVAAAVWASRASAGAPTAAANFSVPPPPSPPPLPAAAAAAAHRQIVEEAAAAMANGTALPVLHGGEL
eukprot:GHVU01213023.1.p1 GENE.GHVU01213023.1~~GHVU01213023.1.p1  ORF type:complete len:237 (+),score=50.41 GHVU01213023.1:83-712(+)